MFIHDNYGSFTAKVIYKDYNNAYIYVYWVVCALGGQLLYYISIQQGIINPTVAKTQQIFSCRL